MRCRKVRSYLSVFCRGEASSEKSEEIKRHLEDCASCRREEKVIRSLHMEVTALPQMETSDDFNARLFARIGKEGFAEKKTKAYFPRRIPVLNTTRLAAVTSVAIVILMLGVGLNMGNILNGPSAPRMAMVQTPELGSEDNLYLTIQPTDNPLLNEHKSVSRMIAQYNRWREYSKSLRDNSGAEHFMGGTDATMASSRTGFSDGGLNSFIVRPVVKQQYLGTP